MNVATKQLIATAFAKGQTEGYDYGFAKGQKAKQEEVSVRRLESITKIINANAQAMEANTRLIMAAERQF